MSDKSTLFDVLIMGSGPAGLQAAVYAARAKAGVAVLGRLVKSSLYKAHVENYCCMDGTFHGAEFLEQGKQQAERFGARFFEQDVVDMKRLEDGAFAISLESGEEWTARTLILAMGISRTRLNVPGEKEFLGKGVSYCVDCDAHFFRDAAVVVVGDESAASWGALTLQLIAREVHLVYNELHVNEHLLYHVEQSGIIKHPGRRVKRITGARAVEAVVLDDETRIETAGVFIELGAKGALELATKLDIALDSESMRYIATNKKQETNVPGIYAAGDICGPPWQMAKAVGEGCVAGLEAASFAKRTRGKEV